ncbi:hypothetical protein [Hyalangium rubrum]|uniref:Uncharacterized protein n=1 Tax=Hyalangium rubrum TaxID=3103134 RepID=A0ABU5HAZ5_9BACT|nr:hypothetical protein [Hyalangium sp. s54d21]MDY7230287.1 hypothetical protein [Hyalangium sp. s54d21]
MSVARHQAGEDLLRILGGRHRIDSHGLEELLHHALGLLGTFQQERLMPTATSIVDGLIQASTRGLTLHEQDAL